MTIASEVVVDSKISVGNLAGFDLGGLAAEQPENRYLFQSVGRGLFERKKVEIIYGGRFGADLVELSRQDQNKELVYQTIQKFIQTYGGSPNYDVVVYQGIPLRRGSGASAAARGATWTALNKLNRTGLTPYEIIRDVAASEGHWDNTAPNILGGYVYIVPKQQTEEGKAAGEKEEAHLIPHSRIPTHGILFIMPPFEKQSTDVLRPPVREFVADFATLETALYRAAMVFSATGSLNFLNLPQEERERVVAQFTQGAPERVPMPYIVARSQELIAHLDNAYKPAEISDWERVNALGMNSIKDQTHIKARANYHPFPDNPTVGGFGPYSYDELLQLTDEMLEEGVFLTLSGAGPNLIGHVDLSTFGQDNLIRATDKSNRFWGSFGYKPYELIYTLTRPTANGVEPVFSGNGRDAQYVTIRTETLERLGTGG